MSLLPNLTEEEYIRQLETIDECAMFLVDIVTRHCSDEDKREMFENFKRITLREYQKSYINNIRSYN